jgi:hypothetical protein
MLTETFLCHGQPSPPADLIPLRAGPLTMLYDPTSGMVRRIKLGEIEVLRGIYAAVRDRNWGTVPATIRERSRQVASDSFRLEFECEHRQADIHFVWQGLIAGDADGTLRYGFNGEARTTFFRNRIGFCVLHPIRECAGARARQFRVDGAAIECRFPKLIEPQIFGRSRFRDLRGVAHEIAPDLWAQVDFEGDTFEMEDQRNWTDASFKTYCTPLTLPFPVEVEAGITFRQVVALKLVSAGATPQLSPIVVTSEEPEPIQLTVPESPAGRMPAIGLGVASHGEPLGDREICNLRQLRLAHLRVDVRLAASQSVAQLRRATREAEQLVVPLELALHLPREGETDPGEVLQFLKQAAAPVVRILALREGEPATTIETLAWVRKHFGTLGVPIGAGSDCNFCELNREHALGRLALLDSDFVFWPVNPQVHATDHLSLMESLEAQTATVVAARAFAAGRPLVISPITLKQRFNPVATAKEPPPASGQLPPQVDPRQLSHFAAAWTLGSVARLSAAAPNSVTYYETTGWRGVQECASGSPLPERFPSSPGALFPVYHAFSKLADFDQVTIVPTKSPEEVSVLALFSASRLKRIVMTNLTGSPHRIHIAAPRITARSILLKSYELVHVDL